jgi:iodotyrosine deiodinase
MYDKKIIENHPYIRYRKPILSDEEMLARSLSFFEAMDLRRSTRAFSDRPIPREVIENLIKTASTAPSGAHKQPWTFCVVENPEIKKQIRIAAEEEELQSYESRMSSDWLDDLKPLPSSSSFLDAYMNLVMTVKRKTTITFKKVWV